MLQQAREVIDPADYLSDHRSGGIDPRAKLPKTVDASRFGKSVEVLITEGSFNQSPAFDLSFFRDLDDVMESARDWTVYAQPNLLLDPENNGWRFLNFVVWDTFNPQPPIVLDVEHGPGAAAVNTTHRVSVLGSAMHIVDPMAIGKLRSLQRLRPGGGSLPLSTNVVIAPGQPEWAKDVHRLVAAAQTSTAAFDIPPFTRTVRAYQLESPAFPAVAMNVFLDFEDATGTVFGSMEILPQTWAESFDSFPVPPTTYLYRVRNGDQIDNANVIIEWGVFA